MTVQVCAGVEEKCTLLGVSGKNWDCQRGKLRLEQKIIKVYTSVLYSFIPFTVVGHKGSSWGLCTGCVRCHWPRNTGQVSFLMTFIHLLWENNGAENERGASRSQRPLMVTHGNYRADWFVETSRTFLFKLNCLHYPVVLSETRHVILILFLIVLLSWSKAENV